ncbi:MAG: glutamine-hydrolyzing carbamoyl-phosphate synthase small subunit [Bacteroidales bacterium]|nr:glutamine-hydrolyzing carbamoyl-phosphate synthase small subunit [Bacteroidales bacterium]
MSKAQIILADGTVFEGRAFGHIASASGTVVFHTGMTGYPELLTDPSLAGHILVLTYPLVGNYGVPDRGIDERGISRCLESEKIQVKGLVVFDHSRSFSHWSAGLSLEDWLAEEKVPGIYDVDTRALVQVLREKGPLKGRLVVGGDNWEGGGIAGSKMVENHPIAEVSCKEVITYPGNPGAKKIVLVDCGVRHSILRNLLRSGLTVVRVPWDYDFRHLSYDGIFISNGPGDPRLCRITIEHIRYALEGEKPVTGICMGHLLLGLAAGGKVIPMKNGHRGHNQPVLDTVTGQCIITSQNHGYALEAESLPEGWIPSFTNMNDGTVEGIRHKSGPFFATQFDTAICKKPLTL